MKHNRYVKVLRDMGSKRFKWLAQPNHRSTVTLTAAGAAVVLIIGGLAFAGHGGPGTQTIRQAASLFSSGPSDSSGKSGDSNSGSTSKNSKSGTSLPTPTTIIGPHGETIVVPPLTPGSNTPGSTGPSGTLDTVLPAPSSPNSATTTPPRPADINGPNVPSANLQITENSPEDPTVTLQVTGADSDGYVSSIAIDWGDGSTPTVQSFPLSACTVPASSSDTVSPQPSHQYSQAASYNIGVTVTSSNCAGDTSSVQQAIAPATVVTGGTQTPPVTTVGGAGNPD